jgi:MFS family permease
VTYLEVIGIMVGQVVVGVIGDWIGRRWGLIQDAAIMFVGLLMITASWGLNLNGWVICYAWSLFFYGTLLRRNSRVFSLLTGVRLRRRRRIPNHCDLVDGERCLRRQALDP